MRKSKKTFIMLVVAIIMLLNSITPAVYAADGSEFISEQVVETMPTENEQAETQMEEIPKLEAEVKEQTIVPNETLETEVLEQTIVPKEQTQVPEVQKESMEQSSETNIPQKEDITIETEITENEVKDESTQTETTKDPSWDSEEDLDKKIPDNPQCPNPEPKPEPKPNPNPPVIIVEKEKDHNSNTNNVYDKNDMNADIHNHNNNDNSNSVIINNTNVNTQNVDMGPVLELIKELDKKRENSNTKCVDKGSSDSTNVRTRTVVKKSCSKQGEAYTPVASTTTLGKCNSSQMSKGKCCKLILKKLDSIDSHLSDQDEVMEKMADVLVDNNLKLNDIKKSVDNIEDDVKSLKKQNTELQDEIKGLTNSIKNFDTMFWVLFAMMALGIVGLMLLLAKRQPIYTPPCNMMYPSNFANNSSYERKYSKVKKAREENYDNENIVSDDSEEVEEEITETEEEVSENEEDDK